MIDARHPRALVVMGVSGAGKTTLGRALAERLGLPFADADDYHPATNVAKMGRGSPLNDADRSPWLAKLADLLREHAERTGIVLACSALKRVYREQLRHSGVDLGFVYLRGSYEVVERRMQQRSGHFMKPALLQSQFEALEEPTHAIVVDVELPTQRQVAVVIDALSELEGA